MGGGEKAGRGLFEGVSRGFLARPQLTVALAGDVSGTCAREGPQAVPAGLEGDLGDREMGVAAAALARSNRRVSR